MKYSTIRVLAVATAVTTAGAFSSVRADSSDDFDDLDDVPAAGAEADPSSGEGADGDAGAAVPGEEGEKPAGDAALIRIFEALPTCTDFDGVVQVLRPGTSSWEEAVVGRRYALGTSYRAIGEGSRAEISFGKNVIVELNTDSSIRTCPQPIAVKSRTIALDSGTIKVTLPDNMPEGRFNVAAPGFTVVNPRGSFRCTYRTAGDGDEAVIRCLQGSLSIQGRHFSVLPMKVASEIRIRTSQDLLFSGLYGKRGDIQLRLDQGRVFVKDDDTGEIREEDKTLDWKLSPNSAVRIYRALPAIGSKLAVSVLTFDANGVLKNHCAFTEQNPLVNSGELTISSKSDNDKQKSMSQASESVDVDVPDEPEEEGDGQSAPAQDAGGAEETPPAAADEDDFF